ncbi:MULTISPECIES: iron-containing alcohol dehydrogenase [unclassified Aureimonas]|uniref:iron-containing alcohol dehydrogenase n=1 Tax=unclassified Aureimonas TaxID=2615206 RepID=UPI0006FE3962|nr:MULTISPECIES: iron-containing alcohol dehydrogenase [unclassified Aureimonas]KQT52629.1 alcohol dehydrogenase [Aureimonas sp. Leaf427]KQT77472.1 alcohol dehydrogenase [Aureimonas sp. Leaf460]
MTLRPFDFRTVPSIEMEWAGARRLGAGLAGRFPARRALLVTDAGLVRAGLIEPIAEGLRQAGFEVAIYDGVVADPPEAVLLAAVEGGRAAGADLVIGLGGGSSLDIAKLAAVLLACDQPLADLYGIGKVRGQRLPLVLVPTTAGTGSEVTNIAILTTGETTKMGVVAPQLYADHVLLDAELTVGLPAIHTAATGIDAMVHAIEAYTSRHRKNPISDALAREALRLLSTHLVTACRTGADRAAREGMLLGAMLAGQAFSNAPVAAVHALAYPLGGHFHIPHGLSNALMLGPVLRFNAKAAASLYAELGEVVGAARGGGVSERSDAFVAAMQQLMDDSGAPRRLRDVGVGADHLPRLAADAMLQTRLLVNNPVEVTQADALALYREAF